MQSSSQHHIIVSGFVFCIQNLNCPKNRYLSVMFIIPTKHIRGPGYVWEISLQIQCPTLEKSVDKLNSAGIGRQSSK